MEGRNRTSWWKVECTNWLPSHVHVIHHGVAHSLSGDHPDCEQIRDRSPSLYARHARATASYKLTCIYELRVHLPQRPNASSGHTHAARRQRRVQLLVDKSSHTPRVRPGLLGNSLPNYSTHQRRGGRSTCDKVEPTNDVDELTNFRECGQLGGGPRGPLVRAAPRAQETPMASRDVAEMLPSPACFNQVEKAPVKAPPPRSDNMTSTRQRHGWVGRREHDNRGQTVGGRQAGIRTLRAGEGRGG